MAEGNDDSEVKHPRQPPAFLEVLCKSSGKVWRFSAGTDAGFAVNLINKKLISTKRGGGENCLLATHIEAVVEGDEEPVSFGPSSQLMDYGSGWKLQTVIESKGDKEQVHTGKQRGPKAYAQGSDESHPSGKTVSPVSLSYIGKILVVFILMFIIGAIFTLFLENLPQLILYINSSV